MNPDDAAERRERLRWGLGGQAAVILGALGLTYLASPAYFLGVAPFVLVATTQAYQRVFRGVERRRILAYWREEAPILGFAPGEPKTRGVIVRLEGALDGRLAHVEVTSQTHVFALLKMPSGRRYTTRTSLALVAPVEDLDLRLEPRRRTRRKGAPDRDHHVNDAATARLLLEAALLDRLAAPGRFEELRLEPEAVRVSRPGYRVAAHVVREDVRIALEIARRVEAHAAALQGRSWDADAALGPIAA